MWLDAWPPVTKTRAVEEDGMEDASLEDFLGGSEGEGGDAAGEDAGRVESDGEGSGRAAGDSEPPGGSDRAPSDREDPAPEAGPGGETEAAPDGDQPDGDQPDGDQQAASGTYTFTPRGASCVACGDEVQRRWRAERGLVCAACKSW